MILLDLFSGVGGFALGFQRAGFQFDRHYFSEKNPHAIANYLYNFKHSQYVGSIEHVSGIKRPDIVTFGSPCQDFSIAGKRDGINGSKSALISYAINIVEEYQPDIFIWENVKGTFTSNQGRDLQAILQRITNIGIYRVEWQLLNSLWFLPQNRERLFLIGHRDGRSMPGVFPIREGERLVYEIPRQSGRSWIERIRIPRQQRSETGKLIRRAYNRIGKRDFNPFQAKEVELIDRKYMNTIVATDHMENYIEVNNELRKLDPRERERLQGFPDDWTKYGLYQNECRELSFLTRGRLMGNAVTVPVVEYIANKIKENYARIH